MKREDAMKFVVGKSYKVYMDNREFKHESVCKYAIMKVTSRSEKFVTFEMDGWRTRRKKTEMKTLIKCGVPSKVEHEYISAFWYGVYACDVEEVQ